MANFKDHFSAHSDQYQSYRPTYPDALFKWLASIAPATEQAWDCATGTGQAATRLAEYFSGVIATDASSQQIQQTSNTPIIRYAIASEACSDIGNSTIDLITVAQAFHWFDSRIFFAEAQRVLKPRGVLAIWSYNLLRISPAVDALIAAFYKDTLGSYWPVERQLVDEGYASVDLPYAEISPPTFKMLQRWNLHEVLGYLGTWSAVKSYQSKHAHNPLDALSQSLSSAWGEPSLKREIAWPLTVRVCARPVAAG